jgi:hypothetical protein
MGDPIWLDNNVLDKALKGDAAINQQLTGYRKAGRPLLVVPAVADEFLNGNVVTGTAAPAPEFRKAMQQGMAKIGVQVDTLAGRPPAKGTVGQMYNVGGDNVSVSDQRVLQQIKAGADARGIAAPEMITAETGAKGMISQSSKWGIKAVPAATPTPGSVPAPPRVDLADEYPAEKEGPISRYFKDRPVLKKLGLIGLNIGAQLLKGAIFKAVQDHFDSVLQDAKKEFDAKYPDPGPLKAKAGLERYKQAYGTALSKLTAPSKAKVAEALILAVTKDRDIAKVKKYLDDQISKVQSAADGTQSGFAKVAEEYVEAMLALYVQLNAYSGLSEIATDVNKRGAVLDSAGRNLETTYFKYVAISAVYPLAYYEWMDVYTVAKQFQSLGGSVLSFASDIQARYELSVSMQKQLNDELIKVSEALAQYAP